MRGAHRGRDFSSRGRDASLARPLVEELRVDWLVLVVVVPGDDVYILKQSKIKLMHAWFSLLV